MHFRGNFVTAPAVIGFPRKMLRLATSLLALHETAALRLGAVPVAPRGMMSAAHRSLPTSVPLSLQTERLRGGALSMSTAATAEKPAAVEKFRKDYAPPPYRVESLKLNFDIREEETLVTSTLTFLAGEAAQSAPTPLELDGEDLELRSIALDGTPLREGDDYTLAPDGLTLLSPPSGAAPFELTTTVAISPAKNTQLSGLYRSSGNYCTQCEAEGFRRITYFQDRPDVMATYEVRVEADKAACPILLSNGNEVGRGELPGGRHWASFSDPFRKPSYLFALVAGDLHGIDDEFVTRSGRRVRLCIWSEPRDSDQLGWAMESLKQAMAWDETTYGLEYDLDVYHIVAVSDFNMGAMENKGLNVFNTAAVLAKPSTATDADYERVQGVVAHEYFHNWSGNRVTCRDWFQLTLKEGLTVYRDQHFSADMTSRAVKRIEEVRVIRSAQFVQDAGPMSHPIRPESYLAMDNFYTVTVYNKGAEVIRMYRTLLGADGFRKGMDLYFERHDGQAVTCDDFRAAMADANGKDLSQFELWYSQAGTPTVRAEGAYDAAAKTFTLSLSQSTPPTPGQKEKRPFHIPVAVGLLGADGSSLLPTTVLELTDASQSFTFEGIAEPPTPSVLRDFSAPVKLAMEMGDDTLAFLAANDADEFNRWDASQRLYSRALLQMAAAHHASGSAESLELPAGVASAFGRILTADGLDRSLQAYSLTLPDFSTLAQEMDVVDPDALCASLRAARRALAAQFRAELQTVYSSLTPDDGAPYSNDAASVGARRLRNVCLSYLSKLDDDDAQGRCLDQFRSASCMTDSLAALAALAPLPGQARDETLDTFYSRAAANKEALVINKWLAVQATADTPDALATVRALMEHPGYDGNNPNSIRSLVQMFASANPAAFHAADGSGYEFVAEQVVELDGRNPQVAARLCNAFNTWRRFDESRQAKMRAALERIRDTPGLSKDTFEIASRSLA